MSVLEHNSLIKLVTKDCKVYKGGSWKSLDGVTSIGCGPPWYCSVQIDTENFKSTKTHFYQCMSPNHQCIDKILKFSLIVTKMDSLFKLAIFFYIYKKDISKRIKNVLNLHKNKALNFLNYWIDLNFNLKMKFWYLHI